jgi:hypothetical protein
MGLDTLRQQGRLEGIGSPRYEDEDVEQRQRQRNTARPRTGNANRIRKRANEMNDEREGTNYQQAGIQIASSLQESSSLRNLSLARVRFEVTGMKKRVLSFSHPRRRRSSAFHEKAGMSQVCFSLSVCSFCFLFPSCGFLAFEPGRLCRHPSIRTLG